MSDFQFLRPLWLLLLLLVPVLTWLLRRAGAGESQWHQVIPRALLKPLLPSPESGDATSRRYHLLPPVLLTVAAIALAGPSFRSAPSPVQQQDDSLVVVLDLSLSMLATDLEPDRLTRATRKIRDLLATREGALTGLVVYAADGHVVTPLTDDRRTVEAMLDALDPTIMPAAGNRADLGVARAVELLEQGAPDRGRILLVTDGLKPRYAGNIRRQLADAPWQLHGLLVGTDQGAPVPLPERGFIREDGEVVIARASPDELQQTTDASGGDTLRMSTSDDDIVRLGLRTEDHERWQQASNERMSERRQDDGYWLLWLALPLALLGWRKGALALVACTLWWAPAGPAHALDWEGIWQTPEQRAPRLIRDDPARAAKKLSDPQWRGTALYRDGQYDRAAEAFARDDSADAHYNRGNALARGGKPQAALDAWEQALARDPDHEAARQNRETLKEFLEQQQQQQSGDDQDNSQGKEEDQDGQDNQQQGSQGQSQDPPDNGSGSGNRQDSQQGDTAGQPPRSQDDSSGTGDRQQENSRREPQGNAGDRGESTGEPATEGDRTADSEDQADALSQSREQWLRRIPDDPGGLLRRKFLQQSQERNVQPDENDTPW